MVVYKPAEHERLLSEIAAGKWLALLVYGGDSGGVSELATNAARAFLGETADAMNLITLDETSLKEDPARLADEAQALSMFGGRRVVRVRDAGETCAKAMEGLMDLPPGETLIVVTAGALKPTARLRKLFEKNQTLAAAPVYEDTARDIQRVIRETLEREGLRAHPDALALLSQILGADRAFTRMELEKLALYCLGREVVTLDDVRAVCGDASAHAMPDMLDAFFCGEMERGVRLFSALLGEGVKPAAVLAAAAAHVNRLMALALPVAAGEAPQRVVNAAKPPIFFKRRDAMIRQLRLWPIARLERAAHSVLKATEESRRLPEELAASIAERCLLSLSVQARRSGR